MVCSALTREGLIDGKLFMTASLRNAVKETAVKVIISLSLDLEVTPRPKPSKPLDSLYLFKIRAHLISAQGFPVSCPLAAGPICRKSLEARARL